MKKLSIVLLALLLVGGMAFAADITVTGSADLSFGFDLDSNDVGLVGATDTSDVDFNITLGSGSASASGEGDVYAVIEGSADVTVDYQDGEDTPDTFEIEAEASIDTAKIVGPDWEVSILGMADGLNYAYSFQDLNADDDVDADDSDVAGSFGDGGGVAVTYGDYTLGADFYKAGAGAATYALFAETSMELAEGLTVGAGVGVADNGVAASVKAAYAADGLTVDVAADFADLTGTFDFDASLVAKTMVSDADVTLNAYYGNDLAVQGIVALAPATVTVTGSTLIGAWDIAAEVAYDVNDMLAVTVDGSFDKASAWDAGAEVVYTMDDYTVTVAGGYASSNVIDFSAEVASTTMISGATLSLGYETADFNTSNGAITAKVSIEL